MISNKKVTCILTWIEIGWHKRFIIDDKPGNMTQLIIQFYVSRKMSTTNFWNQIPPLNDIVSCTGVLDDHIIVNIVTPKANLLRPYKSLQLERIEFHPRYVRIGNHRMDINTIKFIVEDSRDYVNIN